MAPPLLRTSERKDFGRCPWLWEQGWLNGLRPKREPTWAIFGSAFHKAMEVRYPVGTRRGSLNDTIDAFLDYLGEEVRRVGIDIEDLRDEDGDPLADLSKKDVELVLADELGEIMLRNYVRTYGLDREWEVIHTEQPFQIDVPHPTRKGAVMVVYAGTWDAMMRNRRTGKLWLWDHKTAKSFPDVNYLELDSQAGSYLWVAKEVLVHKGIMTKKESIEGIIFNYAKKAKPDPRPTDDFGRALNKDGSLSKRQPSARFLRHPAHRSPAASVQQARRVQAEAQAMAAMRDGIQPVYKNSTPECPRCMFFDLCTLHEQQADGWEDYRDTLFVAKDVYADHREAMSGNGIELGGRK